MGEVGCKLKGKRMKMSEDDCHSRHLGCSQQSSKSIKSLNLEVFTRACLSWKVRLCVTLYCCVKKYRKKNSLFDISKVLSLTFCRVFSIVLQPIEDKNIGRFNCI